MGHRQAVAVRPLHLQRELLLREPTTVLAACQMAHKLETIYLQTSTRNGPGNGPSFPGYPMRRNYGSPGAGPSGVSPMELGAIQPFGGQRPPFYGNRGPGANGAPRNKLSDAEKDELKRLGLCFYCKEHGHLAFRCPNKPGNDKRAGKAPAR